MENPSLRKYPEREFKIETRIFEREARTAVTLRTIYGDLTYLITLSIETAEKSTTAYPHLLEEAKRALLTKESEIKAFNNPSIRRKVHEQRT